MKTSLNVKLSLLIAFFVVIGGVAATDIAMEDQLLAGHFHEKLTAHNDGTFTYAIPSDAYSAYFNGKPYSLNEITSNEQEILLEYDLPATPAKDIASHEFSKTINLKAVTTFHYTVVLPQGSSIAQGTDSDPSIVPYANAVRTNGQSIIIEWAESNSSFPKRYYIRYDEHEDTEEAETIIGEVREKNFLLFSLVILFSGIMIGSFTSWFYRKKHREEDLPIIPEKVLTPDERGIVHLLQKNKLRLSQRDFVKLTGWSKSKISALMVALEKKEIVRREKTGRNYEVFLEKEITR